MNGKEHLIEQHIRAYEARMKHIDELYQRAHTATGKLDESHEAHAQLGELNAQRSLLQQDADEVRTMSLDKWREATVASAGPMAVWDILAQQLEDYIERHE